MLYTWPTKSKERPEVVASVGVYIEEVESGWYKGGKVIHQEEDSRIKS